MKDKVWFQVTCIVVFIAFLPMFSMSQSVATVELVGCVRNDFGNRIGKTMVFNETQGDIVNSNSLGNFKMEVSTGDTLILISDNYYKTVFIVPKVETPFIFQDFTMHFNREAALIQFKRQKSDTINVPKEEKRGEKVTLAGRVLSANGTALVNANITLGNSTNGTVSNKNGVYEIRVSRGDSVYFSYMGHRPQTICVKSDGGDVLMQNVMLVPSAFMLQGVKVIANEVSLNLQYDKTGMDAGEVANYTLRNHAMRTDKTYISTFGISTASFGGLSSIFSGKNGKRAKKVSQKVLDRQAIMRQKVLEIENLPDSVVVSEDNL